MALDPRLLPGTSEQRTLDTAADHERRLRVAERAIRGREPGWTPAVLVNGWTNLGVPWAPASYRQASDGRVEVKGLIVNAGAPTATMFWLPPELAPFDYRMFTPIGAVNGGAYSGMRIDVYPGGEVYFVNFGGWASVTFAPLDQIAFYR